MPSRMFLPVVAGAMFVLTLFFAAPAGAQDTTAPETTSTSTATADPVQEATTADNLNAGGARDADSFRCDFFLRQVSDEDGVLLSQYRRGDDRRDEFIVQRFEQCLSGDVLADTIPDRKLPFTGGMSLLGLAAILVVSLIVGIAVLRAVIRRAG